jgi:dUTPase
MAPRSGTARQQLSVQKQKTDDAYVDEDSEPMISVPIWCRYEEIFLIEKGKRLTLRTK